MKMIHLGGVTCSLSAAALYLLGRTIDKKMEILNSVTRVNQLKELAQLLDAETENLPLVIAISGRVGSDSPIDCELSGLRGVIVEEMAEQHYWKKESNDSRKQESASMLSMSKEVPWYLEDATGRVHVVGTRGAMDFVLPFEIDVFEGSGQSLVHGNKDNTHDMKICGSGIKRIERVLPFGTYLTVIGEAAKDDTGTIRIQQPYEGPFFVSRQTIDQLIADLGKWARWYKCASMGLTIIGAYVIAKHVIQHILERWRCDKLPKRVIAPVAKRSGQDNEGEKADTLPDGSKRMPNLCVICLEQEYNAVFVLCGHMCCCTTCSSHLTICPLCQRRIGKRVKTSSLSSQ